MLRRRFVMERVNEKDKEYRKGDSGPKYLIRGPRMEWGVMRLKPGEEMGQHGHHEVEETFFFFDGEPELIVDGKRHRVAEGDAFRLEPGEMHNIVNKSKRPVRIIFIKTPYLPDDKIK
jgi:mannose-6-phosphate isomerase-like protein (cupin superfamily)